MKCSVCGRPLFPGRVVFRCQCSAITHGQCWEKHVVQDHKPPFTLGYVTMNGEFKPKKVETKETAGHVELVAEKGK